MNAEKKDENMRDTPAKNEQLISAMQMTKK